MLQFVCFKRGQMSKLNLKVDTIGKITVKISILASGPWVVSILIDPAQVAGHSWDEETCTIHAVFLSSFTIFF